MRLYVDRTKKERKKKKPDWYRVAAQLKILNDSSVSLLVIISGLAEPQLLSSSTEPSPSTTCHPLSSTFTC